MVRVVKPSLEGIAAVAEAVKNGLVVCYPTDTVYGLGCDPFNQSAIERAIETKGRGVRALPVLVRSVCEAERLVSFSASGRRLAEKFWPGPVSIVLVAKEGVPKILAPNGTLAVRSPNNAICQQLLALCSGMLVGTSANLTGRPPATSAGEVEKELGGRVDIILDGGKSAIGLASTVVDMTKRRVAVLREGPVSKKEIMVVLKKSG